MTNAEIANIFRRLANLLELRGDNEFKLRAYRNAADLLEDLPTPLAALHAAGGVTRLRELPGVADAQTTVEHTVRVEVAGSDDPILGHLIGLDPAHPPRMNRVALRAGSRQLGTSGDHGRTASTNPRETVSRRVPTHERVVVQ